MARASTLLLMGARTKAAGRMASNTARARSFFTMGIFYKVIFCKVIGRMA